MPATAARERVAFRVSTNFGSGAIPTSGAGVVANDRHQLPQSADNGQTLPYLVEHETLLEAEVGWGLYSSTTNTIQRGTGVNLLFSTSGAANVSFGIGNKSVEIPFTAKDFDALRKYASPGVVNLNQLNFSNPRGATFNPVTISSDVTFGLAAVPHVHGSRIEFLATVTAQVAATWPAQFIYETDGQNGSLPASIGLATYWIRMTYTIDQIGAVRIVVSLYDPFAPPPAHTHTASDIIDLGSLGGSPVPIIADTTLNDTHFSAGSVEATHETVPHVVSVPNGRTPGTRMDILVPHSKAPLWVRRVAGDGNCLGGPMPGYYVVAPGGRAHVRYASAGGNPYLLSDSLILGGPPPASPHTQLLRGRGITPVANNKVISWESSPGGAAWTQSVDANRPVEENGSVRFITIGGVNQFLTKAWVDEISTNQLLIAIALTVNLASITGSNPSIISLYNFSSGTAVNRGVRATVSPTGIIDLQAVINTAANTSPTSVTGITIKSLVPQTVVWWVDRTNSPSVSLFASDTESSVISDRWNEKSHTQPVAWGTSLGLLVIGGQETDRPINMLVHGVMIKQDAGVMDYFKMQDVLAHMRRMYPPQIATLDPG